MKVPTGAKSIELKSNRVGKYILNGTTLVLNLKKECANNRIACSLDREYILDIRCVTFCC